MRPAESERIEEMCEEIWSLTEMGDNTVRAVVSGSKLSRADEALEALTGQGLARIQADRAFLTEQGQVIARAIVRRHRLTEVLFREVLSLEENVTESTACEMEHILSSQVADSICTYLGHPPRCPHGKPIPRGACCEVLRKELRPLVVPLPELEMGKEGRIVFLTAAGQQTLERVASLGIVPGRAARLLQRAPSVILEAGRTRVAVDPEIARQIFVRRDPAV
ncbi:MAG TPA: metal-dependent transcriptional regulator [Candidatus Polarisedimenticolia bacterium]|nr:metal-dependent transcriptional regulator [Candidatus Polarisedimenticolia bacterium]